MMDIFYMLAYPLKKDEDLQTIVSLKAATPVDMDEFQTYWNEILDDFKSYLESKRATTKGLTVTYSPDDPIELALALVEDERSVQKTFLLRKNAVEGYSDSLEFYHTDGFCFHMDNLMDLVGARKDELYPFVAIDPRRTGMVETLLSGSFFTGANHFYGVKLYPRMGVHPLSKPMDSVYQYCSDNNLPITFHCGKSGFPPGVNWKYTDYGNPANFEPVIIKYPKLRIDFAHLGSTDKSYQWAAKIIDMIKKYDNVYTDLSCYTKKSDLDRVKGYCDDKENPKLINRLMFGTDFDVMYFTGKITMQDYYNHFKSVFSADELKKMMHDNPILFMNQ
jgi:predicted TIM-barrel fold metal-dependent hydrolase